MKFVICITIPGKPRLYFSKATRFDLKTERAKVFNDQDFKVLNTVREILESRFTQATFAQMSCWGGASFSDLRIEYIELAPTQRCAAA